MQTALSKLDKLYGLSIDFIKDALPVFHGLIEADNEMTQTLREWIVRTLPEDKAKKFSLEQINECLQISASTFTEDAERVVESYHEFRTALVANTILLLPEENFLFQVWSGDFNGETEVDALDDLEKDIQCYRTDFSEEALAKITLDSLVKEEAPKEKEAPKEREKDRSKEREKSKEKSSGENRSVERERSKDEPKRVTWEDDRKKREDKKKSSR